jgi:integrase/recombinase XerD
MSRFWPDGLPITVTCDALATPTAFAWADHRHTVFYVTWNIRMNGLYYLPYDVCHQARRTTMSEVRWERYPHIAQHAHARAWLQLQSNLCLARNTVEAYGRALDDYFAFCTSGNIYPDGATRAQIGAYVRDLSQRPNPRGNSLQPEVAGLGLANATMQQRLTAVRLFYDYLIEEGLRTHNPVGRGAYTPGKGFGGARDRGLIPHYRKLPWIPSDDQWGAILEAARTEPIRNRVMLTLSYDAALRREEVCALGTADLNPGQRLLRIRAETTKNRQERIIPYSQTTAVLYETYLQHRRTLSRARGPLFLSESRRNYAHPLSIWTWSKVVTAIAQRSGVTQFTTHTMRHLRLTDLARAQWELHAIAQFAGHRSLQSTLRYIHLSGRELAVQLERGMAAIHEWRISKIAEVLG